MGQKNPVGQMNLEHIDGAEGDCQVALELGNELVAENGDNQAKQEIQEESKAAGNTVGLVHVVGGLELAEFDQALGLDLGDVVDGANGRERRKHNQGRNGIAVHLAYQERHDFYHNNKEETAHNRGRLGFAVFIEVRSRIEALELSNINRHEGHDEDDGEHGSCTCAEQTAIKKINTG